MVLLLRILVLAGSLLILCAVNTHCIGQDLVVYPADGQSQEQLDKDKDECYTWAKQQTGIFDPMVQSPASTTTQQSPPREALFVVVHVEHL